MALGIRGANPIWSEVDLQGNLFDDTFYLFVLQNEIPYAPATVWHDPDMSVPWTQPIQFLANGTLPPDIYFSADTPYRLEFRQGPTQQAPLIYEIDNYIAGSGGSTPVDTVAFSSDNQITNPQFALFNLQNPVTISGTNPSPTEIALGWFIFLTGTGTITISQVPLNNSNINPSNAPYALRLTMSGWTSVILQQRFFQNGMLWANKIVSSAVTSFINGVPQTITAQLVDSNSSVLGTVLPITPVNGEWNELTGYAQLPATTNPNTPPSAYIDYQLLLPNNADIYLTSFQLVVQDLPIQPSFIQDSINRQIDHSYHNAYPIVPIGTIIDFGGFSVPEHYFLCDGSTKNRVQNYLLFKALTDIQTVTLTSGLNTFTVTSAANYYIGMAIESPGIPASTTITNIVGTTITMSANATATGPNTMTFFAWGNGDGSTTFNLPNLQGYVTAGSNGTVLPGNNGIGLKGGSSTHTLTTAEVPNLNVSITQHYSIGTLTGPSNVLCGSLSPGTFTSTGTTTNGGGGAHSIVQPTALVKKYIRYQ